jgi:hypothetical protein
MCRITDMQRCSWRSKTGALAWPPAKFGVPLVTRLTRGDLPEQAPVAVDVHGCGALPPQQQLGRHLQQKQMRFLGVFTWQRAAGSGGWEWCEGWGRAGGGVFPPGLSAQEMAGYHSCWLSVLAGLQQQCEIEGHLHKEAGQQWCLQPSSFTKTCQEVHKAAMIL